MRRNDVTAPVIKSDLCRSIQHVGCAVGSQAPKVGTVAATSEALHHLLNDAREACSPRRVLHKPAD